MARRWPDAGGKISRSGGGVTAAGSAAGAATKGVGSGVLKGGPSATAALGAVREGDARLDWIGLGSLVQHLGFYLSQDRRHLVLDLFYCIFFFASFGILVFFRPSFGISISPALYMFLN